MSFIEQREAHYQKFLGKALNEIMHSTDTRTVHVDIYTFPPTTNRPYYTLITGGMSDIRQDIPAGFPTISPRAEILTYTKKPEAWMFNVLKGLAEMPSSDRTWLHWYHSVPNGKPMTAKPSELTAFFFVPPYLEDPKLGPMLIDGDKTDFLVMVPITNKELNFKREHGAQGLLELFDQKNFD